MVNLAHLKAAIEALQARGVTHAELTVRQGWNGQDLHLDAPAPRTFSDQRNIQYSVHVRADRAARDARGLSGFVVLRERHIEDDIKTIVSVE